MPLQNETLSTLIEYVRLADAYQHIGKAQYGAAWVDHEIGVFSRSKVKAVTLNSPDFIQPPQRRIIEPQYKRITSISVKRAPIVSLDDEGIIRHEAMQQFIEKFMKSKTLLLRLNHGLELKLFSELKEEDITSIHFDYVTSELIITGTDGTDKTYEVLVGAISLKRCLDGLVADHKKRAVKPPSNAGRKVTTSSQKTNQIIVDAVKKYPHIHVMKELAQLAQKSLQENGIPLTVGAIEKRMTRYSLLLQQPGTRAKKT